MASLGPLKNIPFFPLRQYKKFLEKPLMVGMGGFALQYFCNDLNGAVQKQGYGVITLVPYIVMFSIMFAVSVFWWVIYVRRLKACDGLDTLLRHRQDTQMNNIEQPAQEIERNKTLQAGDVQMNQALQGFFIRPEEFCSLMDCWFSTRLGELTRDEALVKMKQLVELGNQRSRDVSNIESTADETRAVMNESLETRGRGSRHQSAGSIIDGTRSPVFPVLCPVAAESSSQVRSLSHDDVVLKIPQDVNVEELGEIYDANLPGCRELHRRIEIGAEHRHSKQVLASQILESLRMAWTLNKDSTIQLGSFAICKYTGAGVKCWMLQEEWTPTILDIHRSSQNFFDVVTGERANWTVRGFNLQCATLRVATAEKTQNLTNSHHHKTENGVEVVLFEEPPSLPMFLTGVYISASNLVKVEEDVSVKLHSQAINVQRAFWISVVDTFIPRPYTVGMMATVSLLFHYFVAWHYAMVLFIIVATYIYLSQDHVPPQDGDVPMGGLEPVVEEFSSVADPNSRTLSEGKLAEMDMPIGQQDEAITSGQLDEKLRSGLSIIPRTGVRRKIRTGLRRKIQASEASTSGQLDAKLRSGLTQVNPSVWKLYSPKGKHDVDIIFFHGVQESDYEEAFWKTWLAKGDDQIIWPKDWLSEHLPKARILSVSYNSSASLLKGESEGDAGGVTAIGRNLVQDIILDTVVDIGQNCPVFLVGHCLGGLIIKKLIIEAVKEKREANTELQTTHVERIANFLENFKGAFFYGVPSGGFQKASFDKFISQVKGRSPILKLLKTLDTERGRINKQFRQQHNNLKAQTFGMAESRETIYGGFKGVVVPEASIREDVDNFYTHQNADHFTVCKATDMNDFTVIGKLTQFIKNDTPPGTIWHAADLEQLI